MKNLWRLLVATLAGALLVSSLQAAESAHPTSVDAALEKAKQAHAPVLIDFSAPWCYSCYYMATHVLNGPEWLAVEAKTVVAEIDADSPDGAAWMKKLEVKALPMYVVLDEKGNELGRIVAEQPREKFYPQLNKILAAGNTLDQLKQKALGGSTDATATVLGSYQARGQGKEGLDWFASLPEKSRAVANKNTVVTLWLDRLKLLNALTAKDQPTAMASAQRVLAGDIGCDRPYVIDSLLEASEKLPAAERSKLLHPQKVAMDRFLDQQVFINTPTCADQRSAVISTADVDAALGDTTAESAVLDRAIDATRQRLGNDFSHDRNLADNLRVYLVRAKRNDELDALYPKLIAAYPDDYVYPYRYGRSLFERGNAAAALPLLEQAADKAYGQNRLTVATFRVKALKALKRQADAEKVVSEVLEQNGQWFPEQVAALKTALKS
ncbi:thioredoxin family protein [Pseudolysobacter antarcticus]|nr:thioredoxin family protein [Pseudolysobacter antarcticus]